MGDAPQSARFLIRHGERKPTLAYTDRCGDTRRTPVPVGPRDALREVETAMQRHSRVSIAAEWLDKHRSVTATAV